METMEPSAKDTLAPVEVEVPQSDTPEVAETTQRVAGLDIGVQNTEKVEITPNPNNVSVLLLQRQLTAYTMLNMNEYSEIFAIKSLSDEAIQERVQTLVQSGDSTAFWPTFLSQSDDKLSQYAQDKQLEDELIRGIPQDLRGLIYLKVFRLKYQLTREKYNNLLNKSIYAELPLQEEIKQVEDAKVQSALNVFNYYINEVVSSTANKYEMSSNNYNHDAVNSDDKLRQLHTVIRAGSLLSEIPSLSEEDVLYLLLKFNKLLSNTNFNKLYYCISRALEDQQKEVFLHITKQGINLKTVIQRCVENVLVSLPVLDFLVFQGYPWLTKLFVQVFGAYKPQILDAELDELQKFLESQFFDPDVEAAVQLEPLLMKYENEYYLINVNSLNNNNYELVNCKEIHEELETKIVQLKSELEALNTTHGEILEQFLQYEKDVAEQEKVNEKLVAEHGELKSRFDKLTMKENLDNTIKANREFSDRNRELEAQIELVKQAIERKKEKITKYT